MIIYKVCKECHKKIRRYHNSKYCKKCLNIVNKRTRQRCYNKKYGNRRRKRICLKCKLDFFISSNNQKYCKNCCKERYKEDQKKYYEKNKSHILKLCKISNKKWRNTKKGKVSSRFSLKRRRLLLKELKEEYTMNEWLIKLDKTKGICPKCKKFVGKNKLEIDHIIPVSKAPKGFIYTIDDIQPLCRSCNSSKGNKLGIIK